ncbi:MAG: PEP-CTERM sorting domain-containing protein [Terriglobales bacterium]
MAMRLPFRFRTISVLALPALFLALGSLAFAGPITTNLTLTGAGPANDGQYDIYPYTAQVNGQSYTVVCLDSYDNVTVGESWPVDVLNLGDVLNGSDLTDTRFGNPSAPHYDSNAVTDYEEAAWLETQFGSDTTTNVQIQHAIWDLFNPGFSSDTGNWLSAAANAATSGFGSLDFANFTLFSPTGPTGQEFLTPVSTPEPATWAMLAAGLMMLLAGAGWRRRRAAAIAA